MLETNITLLIIILIFIVTLPNIISKQELLDEEKQSEGYIYSINEEIYETLYPNMCNVENMTCTVDDVTYKVDRIERNRVNNNE